MYQRRVSKCHPRVEAYGTVDELNAALGLARATVRLEPVHGWVLELQKHLIGLMGELATDVADLPQYVRDGYPRLTREITARVEGMIQEVEAREITFRGWALPGDSLGSGALDLSRTVCRRAERFVCGLHEAGQLENPEIIIFLNRLSDLLWLCGRVVDAETAAAPPEPSRAPIPPAPKP
jgi:cob(I)alamin adenosyltransferase